MKTECVLVVEDGEDVSLVPYPDQHRKPYKFLYYKTDDRELLCVGTRKTTNHLSLLLAYESSAKERLSREALLGAGTVVQGFEFMGWHSSSFDVHTPEDLRSRILELLGARNMPE